MTSVSLIGYGEAGAALAHGAGWNARAFDIAPNDYAGVDGTATVAGTLADATLVLSLVTADQALAAAEAAAPYLVAGALWCDMNSVAPATKRAAAAVVEAAGGRYVDAAVMAPVLPARRDVPVLLAGLHAGDAMNALAAAGFSNLSVVDGGVGTAAAIKMIRSVMVKGIEALTAECFLAAHRACVTEAVIGSLGPGWATKADYHLDRMLVHGSRRAMEMDEVVTTLEDLGVEPVMSRATAIRQRKIGRLHLVPPHGLAAKLAAIAA